MISYSKLSLKKSKISIHYIYSKSVTKSCRNLQPKTRSLLLYICDFLAVKFMENKASIFVFQKNFILFKILSENKKEAEHKNVFDIFFICLFFTV